MQKIQVKAHDRSHFVKRKEIFQLKILFDKNVFY